MRFYLVVMLTTLAGQLSGQVRPTVKIGIVLPRTGPLGEFGEQTLRGAQLALTEAGAKDSRLKGLIKVYVEDNESSADTAKEACRRLFVQRKVDMVFGGLTSSVSLSLAEVAHEKKRPFLTPLATHLDVTRKSRYAFRSAMTDPEQGSYAANFFFNTLKLRRAAILAVRDNSYSSQLMRTFEHRFAKMGGQIVARELIEVTATDFQKTLNALKSSGAEAVFFPAPYQLATRVLKEAKANALTIPFVGTEAWNSPAFFELLGRYSSRGHYFITSFFPTAMEENAGRFVESYKQAYREPPTYYSAMGYDGMKTILDAYQRTRGDVSTALTRALGATLKAEGVLGPIRLNRFRNAIKPAMIVETTASGAKFHSLVRAP